MGLLCLAAVLLPRVLPGSPAPGTAAAAALAAVEDGKTTADVSTAGQAQASVASQAAEWARKAGGGAASVVVIAVAEVVAVLICMPGYSAIEYAAGALFGFFWGSVTIAVAKCAAALLAFALIRTLRDSAWGRSVQQRIQGNERGAGLSSRIQKGIETNSFRFCLLVRCSPLPAWLSNYALPLAGVPFHTYLLASAIGTVPPVITNVYAGAVAAAVAASLSGGSARGPCGIVGLLAVGVSVLSSTLLVHQLSSCAAGAGSAEPEPAEAGAGVGED